MTRKLTSHTMWVLASGIVCIAGLASEGYAQADVAPPVVSVDFLGADAVGEAYFQSVVRTAVGQPYDEAVADEDVRRLLRTGRFLSAAFDTRQTAQGVAVTFRVVERPRITAIRVVGNVKFKDKKLLEAVTIAVGDPVDTLSAAESRNAIEAIYHEEGYGDAKVTYNAELLRQTGELVFNIEEGVRIRVRKILYEGNDSILERELNKHINTTTYLWIFRDGKFDVETVESDTFAIQAYYRDQGYLDARASYRLEYSEDGCDLTVAFIIAEGARYSIESISFRGNAVFNDVQLRGRMRLAVGEVMKRPQLEKDVRSIQTLYGENGYIYAGVAAQRVFSETPGLVRVIIEIDESEQIRVGRIVVRGNEQTKDKVVRRSLELFPEEVFNLTEAREAEKRLLQTQIFSKAAVTPVGTTPGVRDVLINVEESAREGDLIFGVGVTSNSGLVGSFVIDIKNFDLFDYPRSFSEFIKLRAFHGAGQRLRIEAQPGTELNRFRIDFTEPYFLDRPLNFGLSTYLFSRGREGYDEQRVGVNVSLGKRFHRGILEGWFGELSLRIENVDIDPEDIFTSREIRKDRGNNLLTSIKATLVRDRTDNRFIPTKGDRFRFSWEQAGVLGGDHIFAKVTAGYTWHKTVAVDVQDRKSVVSLRADVGAILGEAPAFERFYAGGIGSLRGFKFRGVSPRRGIRDDAIGGDLLILLGAEYSFPLYGETLRGVVFSDMGTVGDDYGVDAWRMTVGAGVRMTVQFLGPIPLEFNLAVPVASQGEDEEQAFSFFMGAVF
ncbi:MAG: outer membrane protein assembly factor [Phycisphaerae bacterium]|nr:outer membrane protein assembly factor [Phycisphaerae bacterium]